MPHMILVLIQAEKISASVPLSRLKDYESDLRGDRIHASCAVDRYYSIYQHHEAEYSLEYENAAIAERLLPY